MSNYQKFYNELVIVGELKDLKIKPYISKNGTNMTNIYAKISVKDNDKISNYNVQYAFATDSEFYQKHGQTMLSLKTATQNGVGDIVRVSGEIRKSEYCKNGEQDIVSIPQYVGKNILFKLNINDNSNQQIAGVVLESIIADIKDELKDGMPTGRKQVRLLSLGYAENIIYEFIAYVEKELANDFVKFYKIGNVAKLNLKPYNAVIVKEEVNSNNNKMGFGESLPVFTTNSYYNDIIIIGGEPINIDKQYTEEQIMELNKQIELNRKNIIESSQNKSKQLNNNTNPFTMNQNSTIPTNNPFANGVFGVNVNDNSSFAYLND